ncbi:hypothetical protein [Paraburkholderia tuberum]|uniref:hypothetical protein n=1 Tax=Paraburkholderia tuberum TaxID=157910 RepID=UPI0013A6ECF4|nr:hypothetical protein [Paraburkholderia tuberum]
MIVVDLPAALWVEKKGYFWLFLAVSGFWVFFCRCSGFVGLSLLTYRSISVAPVRGGAFSVVRAFLAFPCCLVGLLALPLCGAAPTFFAAAKKVGKEDS